MSEPQSRAPGSRAPGSRKGDLTQGPIMGTLLRFSAPTLLANVLQSLNGTVNAIWVGRMLGGSALAATANANVVMFLVFAATFGFGMAATVKIGQAFGAGNVDAARRTFGTAMGFCVGLSLVVAVAGWIGAPALLHAMSTPPVVYAFALAYLRVIFIAMPAQMISVILSMSMRGAGDARTPLRMMIVSVVLDVALNPLLIGGWGPVPAFGIAGSALATTIASTIAMLAYVVVLYANDLPVRLRRGELHYLIPHPAELRFIVTKGLPMGAQMLLVSMAGIVMVGLVNREGAMASAAYGASLQVWTYLQMPALAISAAVSAMAAQTIGARLFDRLDAITRAGVLLNLAMTGVMTALLLTFDRPVLELFLGAHSPTVGLARHIQFLASWTYVLFGVTIVMFGTMRAAGTVLPPLLVLGIAMYPGRLGFYQMTHAALGMDAIWLSFPVGSMIALVLAYASYRLIPWRKRAEQPRVPRSREPAVA
jgi:putative MATE family efflux protein